MNKEKKTLKDRMNRMQDPYRLIIRNKETFSEVGSYDLSLLNLYIFISVILVIMGIIVFLLFAYTPMKRLMPGYGDKATFQEAYELNQKLVILEEQVEAQELYIRNVQNVISGRIDTLEKRPEAYDSIELVTQEPAQRIMEDEMLRRKVDLGNVDLRQDVLILGEESLDKMYFVPPVSGFVSAEFDREAGHFGIDIASPKDTPIKAISDGVVIMADWTLETGNTIGIQHNQSVISFYKHNAALLKKIGEPVDAGEAIAIIGNSGTLSSGPHLHFELWNNGKPMDPREYIEFGTAK
jgi:murein DD-endopeptidase MepM/ murein hydrolase activator NlpD